MITEFLNNNFETHNEYILGTLKSKRINNFFNLKDFSTFVETGTYKGDGVQWALDNHFKKIYSVEIHKELYEQSTLRYEHIPQVKISNADTVNFLNVVLPKITDKTLFYLDAHISGADSSYNPEHPVPLEKEAKLITDLFFDLTQAIIVVDDARLWDKEIVHNVYKTFKDKNLVMSFIDDSYVFCDKKLILKN
jgi:hypothetical protein